MRAFLRIIAVVITLIAIFMLPLALFGFQIGQILFSPQAMLNLVSGHVIGPSQANIVADTLLQSLPPQWGINDDSTLGKALSAAAEQAAIQASLLPTELQVKYAAQGLNSFYTWLDGPDPMPLLELDMQPLKSHLNLHTDEVVNNVLDQIPACTTVESLDMAATLIGTLLGGDLVLEQLPSCLPAIVPIESVTPAISLLLRQQLTHIPDTIILDQLVQATPERMQEIKSSLQLAKGMLQWSWLLIIFLLLFGALIGGQTRDGVPRWLGWSFVAGGVLTFLFTLIPADFWLAVASSQLADWPPLLQVPVAAMIGPLFEQAGQESVWWAAALVVVGLLLVLLSVLLRRRGPEPF